MKIESLVIGHLQLIIGNMQLVIGIMQFPFCSRQQEKGNRQLLIGQTKVFLQCGDSGQSRVSGLIRLSKQNGVSSQIRISRHIEVS